VKKITNSKTAGENPAVDLEAEALKQADAEVLQADICKLSDFTVEIEGQKVKAAIKGNAGINISGVHYTVEQFLDDEALQIKAVQMNHIMLKIN
jgi:hypothetical protein